MSTTSKANEVSPRLLGRSEQIRKVVALAEKAAQTDLPVLIVGETGTGKELVALQIHGQSTRAGKNFVPVNTGALPREIVASELFGHRKGSFTGATSDKLGRFREADGGTLFLDEIGTMDDAVQVALLRSLETNTFRPIGAAADEHVNVRLIGAMNEDPRELAESGMFRQDLLYRFEVMRIDLPPLREIRSDIPELVNHFVGLTSRVYDLQIQGVSTDAMLALMSYHWPGNTRELKNAVAQACVLAERGPIGLEHLPARWKVNSGMFATANDRGAGVTPAVRDMDSVRPSLSTSATTNSASDRTNDAPTSGRHVADGVYMPLGATLEEVQKVYALKTLEVCNNNKTKAAKVLGVSRKTLYDRLDRWYHR